MQTKISYALLALLSLFVSDVALAGHVHGKQKASSKTRFLDCTQQRTFPGARGSQPFTTWKFILIWNEAQPPTTFFWRPDGQRWITTAVSRVHHYSKAKKGKLSAYSLEEIDLKNIRRGDTIEVATFPNGRDIMPNAVKSKQAGALYYQTAASDKQWLYLTPSIRKVEDVIMP